MGDICINAGEFRHQITLQEATRTDDVNGSFSNSWSTLAVVWAKIEVLTGTEQVQSDRLEGKTFFRFIFRYQPEVDKVDRVLHDGRTFGITEVKNIQERNQLTIIRAIEEDTEA